jgi:hypothetical protein
MDDGYDDPRSMVQIEMKRSGLTIIPLVGRFCDLGFRLMNYQFRNKLPVSKRLARTRGVPKLFIQSDDRAALANETVQIFMRAPDPKQMMRDRLSYADMSEDDRHNYENMIVNFFLQSIPPASRR